MLVFRSLAGTEVVNIQKAFHTRANRPHNIVNFNTEQRDREDAALWNAHFL